MSKMKMAVKLLSPYEIIMTVLEQRHTMSKMRKSDSRSALIRVRPHSLSSVTSQYLRTVLPHLRKMSGQ